MEHGLVSPLFDKELPDLVQIRAWADEEGCKILEGAARLSAWRRDVESRIHDAPEIPSARSGRLSTSVTRTDLLRAVLAMYPDALGVSSLRDFSLGDAPARWAQAIAEAPIEPQPDSVERSVARAWMLEHASDPGTRIGVSSIVGAIGFEGAMALSAFDTHYVQGLITLRESACRILDDQGRQGKGTMGGAPVLPIYFDRNRYLAEMDTALTRGPGVVVVSDRPSCGRHALVEAWLQNLVYERKPEGLAPLEGRSILSALDVRRLNQDFFDSGDDALLFGLSRGKRGAYLTLRQAVGLRPGWADDIAVVAEDAKAPDYKVIVTISKDREHQLAEAHEFYKTLPRVEVLAPTDADLLTLWWCQLPFAERRVGVVATLP